MTTHEDIRRRLTEIFQDVLDDRTLELSDATTALDVEGWDSLTHITLIAAVEKAFKVSFTTKQVTGFRTVGDLARAIETRVP